MIRRECDRRNYLGSIAGADAGSKTPQKFLPPRQFQMVDEIDVKRIARLGKISLGSICTVVIGLKLNVRPITEHTLPTTHQIATGQFGVLFHIGRVWLRVTCDLQPLSGLTSIKVTLKRECIAIV